MTFVELYKEISNITALRENRLRYAKMVLNDMSLVPKLMDIVFMVDDKVSCKAAWVFEFVCSKYMDAIIPYLDRFTGNLNRIHLDSAVRSVAKSCQLITTTYYGKTPNSLQKSLSSTHKKLIAETCFDWMISDQKVAPKAYSMETLYLLGKENIWIHDELALILEHDFHKQSSGFKSRAKRTLQKIKKHKK